MNSEKLYRFPHPNEYVAGKGPTFNDYCEWKIKDNGSQGAYEILERKILEMIQDLHQ